MTIAAGPATTTEVAEERPDVPSLLSVDVGLPQHVAWRGKSVYTGFWKRPVDGPRLLHSLNIDGDGQGTDGHGGEQRAVLVYQIVLDM
jgi:MOSC domain-containing protein YiiM